MDVRVLRYFLAVAREGNMTRAAERLHVTQPTLSRQLKSLEETVGKKLFVRSNYAIKLTDEILFPEGDDRDEKQAETIANKIDLIAPKVAAAAAGDRLIVFKLLAERQYVKK